MHIRLAILLAGISTLLLVEHGANAHVVNASTVRINVFANTLTIEQTTPLTTAILASGFKQKNTPNHGWIAQKLVERWRVSIAGRPCREKQHKHALTDRDTQFELQLVLACNVKGDIKIALDWLASANRAHHASVELVIANKRKIAIVPQTQPVLLIPIDELLREWGEKLQPISQTL